MIYDLETIHDFERGNYAEKGMHECSSEEQRLWKERSQIIEFAAINVLTGEQMCVRCRPEFSWEEVRSEAAKLFARDHGHDLIIRDQSLGFFRDVWDREVAPFLARAAGPAGVLGMVAHNGDQFDHIVLGKELKRLNLCLFRADSNLHPNYPPIAKMVGFDTIRTLKTKYGDYSGRGGQWSLRSLHSRHVQSRSEDGSEAFLSSPRKDPREHHAMGDCELLMEVLENWPDLASTIAREIAKTLSHEGSEPEDSPPGPIEQTVCRLFLQPVYYLVHQAQAQSSAQAVPWNPQMSPPVSELSSNAIPYTSMQPLPQQPMHGTYQPAHWGQQVVAPSLTNPQSRYMPTQGDTASVVAADIARAQAAAAAAASATSHKAALQSMRCTVPPAVAQASAASATELLPPVQDFRGAHSATAQLESFPESTDQEPKDVRKTSAWEASETEAAATARREILAAIGLGDESSFIGPEDEDLGDEDGQSRKKRVKKKRSKKYPDRFDEDRDADGGGKDSVRESGMDETKESGRDGRDAKDGGKGSGKFGGKDGKDAGKDRTRDAAGKGGKEDWRVDGKERRGKDGGAGVKKPEGKQDGGKGGDKDGRNGKDDGVDGDGGKGGKEVPKGKDKEDKEARDSEGRERDWETDGVRDGGKDLGKHGVRGLKDGKDGKGSTKDRYSAGKADNFGVDGGTNSREGKTKWEKWEKWDDKAGWWDKWEKTQSQAPEFQNRGKDRVRSEYIGRGQGGKDKEPEREKGKGKGEKGKGEKDVQADHDEGYSRDRTRRRERDRHDGAPPERVDTVSQQGFGMTSMGNIQFQ